MKKPVQPETNDKAFLRCLGQLEHRHSREAFGDFCKLYALSFANAMGNAGCAPKDEAWEKREAEYMRTVKQYSKEEMALWPEMQGCVARALDFTDESRRDPWHNGAEFLGHLFMGPLEGGAGKWDGDLAFTPWRVCYAMAKLTLHSGGIHEAIKDHGFFTMCEPACGAGVMVIAAAKSLYDDGMTDFQQKMHVTAWDIREICFHMTFIQLSLLHIPAVVILGNTLSGEIRQRWVTPAHTLGLWDYKLAREYRKQQVADEQAKRAKLQVALPPLIAFLKAYINKPFALDGGSVDNKARNNYAVVKSPKRSLPALPPPQTGGLFEHLS